MEYIKVFIVGGIVCAIAQLLMDKTKLMPARIVLIYVLLGVTISGLSFYDTIEAFAGAGITVPIVGFGITLGQGVIKAIEENGLLGALSGGLIATAPGISLTIVLGYIASLLFNPKAKK
jgi:stage V sporulation protein AE